MAKFEPDMTDKEFEIVCAEARAKNEARAKERKRIDQKRAYCQAMDRFDPEAECTSCIRGED